MFSRHPPTLHRALISAVVCALLLGLSGKHAHADDAEERWAVATEKMAAGQDAEAVHSLLALFRDVPSSSLADDALFLAGTLQEEKLADPVGALASYRLLLKHFPDSRSALASRRRLDALEAAIGTDGAGAEPLARFSEILSGFPDRKPEASLELARTLLAEFPAWSDSYRVRQWIADTHRRRGDLRQALRNYRAVQESDAPAEGKLHASLGVAEIHILLGEHSKAKRELDALGALSLGGAEMQAVEELAELSRTTRTRSRLVRLSYVGVALALLSLLVLVRRSCADAGACFDELKRPPFEVLYMLPFVALMMAMAFSGHREIGPAVALIGVGGLFLAWFCGCALRAREPLGRGYAALCAAIATFGSLCLVYLAVYRSALLDLILTTVRFGPE